MLRIRAGLHVGAYMCTKIKASSTISGPWTELKKLRSDKAKTQATSSSVKFTEGMDSQCDLPGNMVLSNIRIRLD